MKKIIFVLILLPVIVFGEEKNQNDTTKVWNKRFLTSFSITQVSYSNWVQGGENAISWTSDINSKFEKDTKKLNWTTIGKFRYGQTKQEKLGTRKTIDNIDISTTYIKKYNIALNPFISSALRTQFSKGYDYKETVSIPKSDFCDPLYLSQSAGVGFLFRKALKTRLGAALREIFASTYAEFGYTDDPTTLKIEKRKIETGITSETTFNKKVDNNFFIDSKIELFSAFEGMKKVDVVFENTFTVFVAKYITVKFETLIYYDWDVSKTIQTKQTLGMGFAYNLF